MLDYLKGNCDPNTTKGTSCLLLKKTFQCYQICKNWSDTLKVQLLQKYVFPFYFYFYFTHYFVHYLRINLWLTRCSFCHNYVIQKVHRIRMKYIMYSFFWVISIEFCVISSICVRLYWNKVFIKFTKL